MPRKGKTAVHRKSKPLVAGSLRKRNWKRFLRGPDSELLDELYVPALTEAVRYDRCCAYFSSTVLAAAARGFGALIERLLSLDKKAPRPAVRLVVNEELSADDVKALIERNDTSGLEKTLKRRFKNPKDLLVKRRLAMLGWLVREGLLEVRVGVMRNSSGLVHAKFGIVTDEKDDAVVFCGSGNESAQGLVANYERLEISTSWKDVERHAEYADEFDALWRDGHPEVHTVSLPEALRLKLIKFAPKEPPVDEPQMASERRRLAMLWKFIVEAPYLPNGAAACDATGMVELWPHQRRIVEETARAWPDGRLLCDEVGLGKTIEAIFILRRLMAGRGVGRVLLLLPKSILKQWQAELREKGGLIFPRLEGPATLVWPDEKAKRVSGLAEALKEDVLLMSREMARLEHNLAVLLDAPPWDLVLLDEAHAARRREQREGEFNAGTLLLNLLRQLQLRRRTRSIMLLSATPMQTHPWEPWDLLTVLGEGGMWLSEFSRVREYYHAVKALEEGHCGSDLARRASSLIASDSLFPEAPCDGVSLRDPEALSQALAFASPTQRDQFARWLRRGSPLGRRMHRSSRGTLRAYYDMGILAEAPPERTVNDVMFDFRDGAERNVYDSIARYISRRFEALENEKPGKGFVMTVYRRRASSSFFALRKSLERRQDGLKRVAQRHVYYRELSEDDIPEALDPDELPEGEDAGTISSAYPDNPTVAREELAEVGRLLEELKLLGQRDSKRDRFFEILRSITDDGRAALVFTEYRDTMDYLCEWLVSWYATGLGRYCGDGGQIWNGEQWQHVTKDSITRMLREGRLRVLVCTDAASEGLNLQAAGALINYDLPWNPSRVEQRIGRIDRIGQRCGIVRVVNLFLKDSVDDRVYTVLRSRCGLFEHFVGAMQPVLARARRMLMGREKVNLGELEEAASEMERDSLPQETYLEAEAERLSGKRAPVTLKDVREVLGSFTEDANVRVRKSKRTGLIEITGLTRKKLLFADTVSLLERYENAIPLSPAASELAQIAEKLWRSGERLPLVVESHQHGPFRVSIAVWITGVTPTPVNSIAALKRLVDSWDGVCPAPEAWQKAVKQARNKARRRVRAMVQVADEREKQSLDRQIDAARFRLILELGRYLVCLDTSTDDLNGRLYKQMSRDIASSQRLKRCLERLGGYPHWPVDLRSELKEFALQIADNRRRARQIGSEIDAALEDPRWTAQAKQSS